MRNPAGAGAPILLLAACAVLAGCAGHRTAIVVPGGVEDPLAPARAALAQGHDLQAQSRLADFLRNNPGSAVVDEAYFLRGRVYLIQKERVLAADDFQRVLRDYPQSRFAPEASYFLAATYDQLSRPSQLDQDWTDKAIGAYRGFINRYPERPEAAEAKTRITALTDRLAKKEYEAGVIYLKLNAPLSAAIYFERCVEDYPESSWFCRSGLGLGEARVKINDYAAAARALEKLDTGCTDPEIKAKADDLLTRVRAWLAAHPGAKADSVADSASAK